MKFRTLIFAAIVLFTNIAHSEPVNTIVKESDTAKTDGPPIVIKELVKLKSPDSEVADAILYLKNNVEEEDRSSIKFFTTYAIPTKEQREHSILEVSFLCHSMIGASSADSTTIAGGYFPLAVQDGDTFTPIQRVPGSDTLWWIDIRDFNWTEQAWENMMREDGYFVEPIVTHDNNSLLRLYSGNAVVRSDWFVQHASSITSQSDVDSKTKIYKEFLYGALKTTPKNVVEFEKTWGIDTEKARKIGNVYGTLVTKSETVARHNRILIGYRTELGWYYRSYDVKNIRGRRDYAENILDFKGNPPDVFDAGEIFATNFLHLQVYDIYNDKEVLIDFADPTIVRHMSDVLGDARVRTAQSCMDCHAAGPIPSENTLYEFIQARAKGYQYDKNDALRTKRVMLDKQFEDSISENQNLFAKSLLRVNGLTPTVNCKYYLEQITGYNRDLTLEQAAFECGLTVEAYVNGLTDENKIQQNKVPFRIATLLKTKEPIPREAWESPGADGQPGLFQQSMIMIHGLTKITLEDKVVDINVVKLIVAIKDGNIVTGSTTVGTYKVGDELVWDGSEKNGFFGVSSINGKPVSGYVATSSMKHK